MAALKFVGIVCLVLAPIQAVPLDGKIRAAADGSEEAYLVSRGPQQLHCLSDVILSSDSLHRSKATTHQPWRSYPTVALLQPGSVAYMKVSLPW